MTRDDPHDLARFVEAQSTTIETALAELRRGRKESHWMWFVFPQLAALGRSSTARFYGLRSIEEARAFLAHPTLGERLVECARAATAAIEGGRDLGEVFGSPDDLKFRSSMTLFERAAEPDRRAAFAAALDRCCGGVRDQRTLALLDEAGG